MPKSSVAGILDAKGGLRVVVTERWRMRHHVGKGERLFVLPDLTVQEPVAYDKRAGLFAEVRRYIRSQLGCGGCTLCCKVMPVASGDFVKHSQHDCRHCHVGGGCKIYDSRPQECRVFECLWLKSQEGAEPMAAELRPDRCGVIFCEDTAAARGEPPDPDLFEVHVDRDRPNAIADSFFVVEHLLAERAKGRKDKLITFYFGEERP